MRTVRDLKVSGKRVLVRLDLDLPFKGDVVMDDTRIIKAIPTLKLLLQGKPKQIIIVGHRGRPEGKRELTLSLAPCASILSKALGLKVCFIPETLPEKLPPDQVLLLENIRYDPGEEANDPKTAKRLASYADFFIHEAFATAHRAHASSAGVAAHLPSVFGLQFAKEIEMLTLEDKPHPLVGIFGAAKVKDKVPLIKAFAQQSDAILLGGAIVFTFMKAAGYGVGKSLVERESLTTVADLTEEYGDQIQFPKDFVTAKEMKTGVDTKTVEFHKIPSDSMGLDLGPKSVAFFKKRLEEAKTIIWNGPLGVCEIPE